jgi:hypothetical protein
MLGPQYIAVQVTLTLANTNYNILELVQALEPTCPAACRELQIQAATGNADVVLLGDAKLSATRMGFELARLESRTWRSNHSNVILGGKYARSVTAGQNLNVEIEV